MLKKYAVILILISSLVLTACAGKASVNTTSAPKAQEITTPRQLENPAEQVQKDEPSQHIAPEPPKENQPTAPLTPTKPEEPVPPVVAPKEEPKEVPKEKPKEQPKEEPKETPKEEPSELLVEYWKEVEEQIIALCNEERVKAGVAPLEGNEKLREIARFKSKEMLQHNYFAHESAVDGAMPWDVAKRFGYSYSTFGENIWMTKMDSEDPRWTEKFKAAVTAQDIVTDWMNSPGHRENILNPKFGKIGVGLVYSSKLKAYATQSFSN